MKRSVLPRKQKKAWKKKIKRANELAIKDPSITMTALWEMYQKEIEFMNLYSSLLRVRVFAKK